MHTRATIALVLSTTISLAACGGDGEQEDPATPAATPEQSAPATTGMPGMPAAGGDITAQMEAHLRMLDGANADSLRAMLPMHRQMVGNMLSQFDRDMRGMNMSGNTAWQATVDSVRQDNSRLAGMSASEIQSFMPEHMGRVRRLVQMHHSMM